MKHEHDLALPVLTVLAESENGKLTTGIVRNRVKETIELSDEDLEPLRNRSDRRIDQIIRNLKSHKKCPGNPFFEGYLRDIPRGFEITEKGRAVLQAML